MRTSRDELVARYCARRHWSDLRITDLFDAAVRAAPDRLAVIDPPNRTELTDGPALRLSFAELSALVDACAWHLHQLGFVRDDILVTQLPNIAEYIAVYLAAARLGVIVSPVPMQFRGHELEQIVALTAARNVLTVATFKGARHDFSCAGQGGGSPRVLTLGNIAAPGATPFAPAALDAPTRAALRDHIGSLAISADDIVTICWTSGTEAAPKGVPRSHNHWIAISHAHFTGAGIRPGDRLLNPFPLVNMAAIGGCFMSWLHAAGTLVLHHPFDLQVYLRQVTAERVQYAIAPPAILNMLIKDPRLLADADLSSLRCIGSGSAPLDPVMIREFRERFGIEIMNMFGSNEGMALVNNAEYAPEPERRARYFPRFGRPEIEWANPPPIAIETRLVDPDSGEEILAADTPGEMQIRGPTVFDGYYGAPGLTSRAFTPDGYFRTGDLFDIPGGADRMRYYRFVGRLKQLIVRGGVKISPEELDDVLAQIPQVLEGAVTGYRDEIMGERICAVVVVRPGADLTLEAVRQHFAASGLASFKRPERLCIVAQLPRNSTGKVVRAELARIAAQVAAGADPAPVQTSTA
ncbi:MAG: AMP-dependent acyl-CoA synthetase [Steroidobacteraceae bacterium]